MSDTTKSFILGGLMGLVIVGVFYAIANPTEEEPEVAGTVQVSEQADFKEAYMGGCMDADASEKECDCTWDYFYREIGFDGIVDLSAEITKTGNFPKIVVDAAEYCSR